MKVLIIDDSHVKNIFLESCLQENGIEIIKKSDIVSSVECFSDDESINTIDCIFLDMGLYFFNNQDYDEKQGLFILDELRRRGKKVPVIINSSTKLTPEEMAKYDNIIGVLENSADVNSIKDIIKQIKNGH